MLNTFKDGIMTMVETGIQTKEFESVEIEPFVWGLMATLDGLAAYACFVDDLDLRKIMQVYGDVLLRGLGANQDLLENKA